MTKTIYKICSKDEWNEAKKQTVFLGSKIDKKDGFIHFSAGNQVHETAKLHFNGEEGLVLLEIRTEKLNIKWERSRNDDFFPHLYGILPIKEVTKEYTLTLDENKNHILPSWLDVK